MKKMTEETTVKPKRSRNRPMLYFFLLLIVGIAALWTFGPREDVSMVANFDESAIGEDIDGYLAQREARYDDIRDTAFKEIVWAFPQSKARTPVSIVFIHGFSASKGEVRPVPDIAAKQLQANLFFTRLTGHGRSDGPMAEATVQSWFDDVQEAIAIGEKLGEKVVLVTVSTGGTLASVAATHPQLKERIDGIVFISPNFKVNNPMAWLLTVPFAETLVPMILGPDRGFTPKNELHAEYWTENYPSVAVLPMAAIVKQAQRGNYYSATTPALFIFSDSDKVVDHTMTRSIEEKWAGPSTIITVGNSDDEDHHVIAGDAVSPSTTEKLANDVVEWVNNIVTG